MSGTLGIDPHIRHEGGCAMRTRQQKALAEQRLEFRLWKRWRRERLDALLAGPYAEPVQALLGFIKTMTGPSALVDFVISGPWAETNADVRFEILALIDAVIMKRREKMGLAPFDDALPGQPENTFLILRAHLAPQPPDGGATRGGARFNQQDTLNEKDTNHE
jgi:hypothetical protein